MITNIITDIVTYFKLANSSHLSDTIYRIVCIYICYAKIYSTDNKDHSYRIGNSHLSVHMTCGLTNFISRVAEERTLYMEKTPQWSP